MFRLKLYKTVCFISHFNMSKVVLRGLRAARHGMVSYKGSFFQS